MAQSEFRGTIKRTQRNELVAELSWDDCQKVIQSNLSRYGAGAQITVSGVECSVITVGQRFKSNGYAKGYVYLVETVAGPNNPSQANEYDADLLEELGFASAGLKIREMDGTPS